MSENLQTLIAYATDNNYLWSIGNHEQWAYDARIMHTYYSKADRRYYYPTRVGQGNTLEEAVANCLRKCKENPIKEKL